MGEGLGADGAAGHLLQVVVAYGGGGGEGTGDVVGVDDAALLGGVSPDAGEAVGLELEVDGEVVALAWVLAGKRDFPALDAEELLDVVAELVGDDVGLGELGGGASEALELVPEGKVDVDLFVLRAVEGAGGGLGGAAAGVGGGAGR